MTIYDDLSRQQPAAPQPQPTVFTHVAGILTELNANLLVSKLYEHGLGARLQPHHVQTVVDFVAGLERRELPAQDAQDEAAEPVAQ